VRGNVQKHLSFPKGPQQGRSHSPARSVLSVRERERREERQVCEPEGGKKATESGQAAQAKPENPAGLSAEALAKVDGFFQHSQ